jgi:hypothetical protein
MAPHDTTQYYISPHDTTQAYHFAARHSVSPHITGTGPPMNKPKFEIAIDTRLLYQRLTQAEVGQTVTYEELSAEVSRPITGDDHNLQSALRRAFRDDGMVFSNIMRVGYTRLTDADIVKTSDADIGKLRRASKRAAERLFSVKEFDALPNELKLKHATSASVFGAIAASLKKKGIAQVEAAVRDVGKELPVAETLRLFSK